MSRLILPGPATTRRLLQGTPPLLLDTFTDTNGVNVASGGHVMDKGPGWTLGGVAVVNVTIQGNQADCSATGGAVYGWADAGKADVTITGDVTTGDTATQGNHGLLARVLDVNSWWMADLVTTSNVLRIVENNATVVTVRASVALTVAVNTTYSMKFAMIGSSLVASVGGTSVNYTSTLFQAFTKHGWGGNKKGTTFGTRIDNLRVAA